MDYEDIILGGLCSALRTGAPGVDQPRMIKSRILELERRELIVWKREGWYLTKEGKALVRRTRTEARRRQRLKRG